jgi:transposase
MAMRREGYTVREIAARIGRAVSTTQGIIDREREKNLG